MRTHLIAIFALAALLSTSFAQSATDPLISIRPADGESSVPKQTAQPLVSPTVDSTKPASSSNRKVRYIRRKKSTSSTTSTSSSRSSSSATTTKSSSSSESSSTSSSLPLPQSNATVSTPQQPVVLDAAAAQATEEEIKRRQLFIARANKAVYDADRLKMAGELESAAKRYQYVLDVTAPTGKTEFLHNKAKNSLATTRAELGNVAYENKDYKAASENYEVASKLFPENSNYSERLAKARDKWLKEGGLVPSGNSKTTSSSSSTKSKTRRQSAPREKYEPSDYRTRETPVSRPTLPTGSRIRVQDPLSQ